MSTHSLVGENERRRPDLDIRVYSHMDNRILENHDYPSDNNLIHRCSQHHEDSLLCRISIRYSAAIQRKYKYVYWIQILYRSSNSIGSTSIIYQR